MLKRSYKDLTEDGQSGDTFFAAVKLMHAKRYPIVLLENVMGAEWAAMRAYITGRLHLSTTKEVKDAKNDVIFEAVDGAYRVIAAPKDGWAGQCNLKLLRSHLRTAHAPPRAR